MEKNFTLINFNFFKKNNEIAMYSTFNKGKSVAAERFIKTLKNKIYKYTTTSWKKCLF